MKKKTRLVAGLKEIMVKGVTIPNHDGEGVA